ncbi:hypothetical protein H6F67_17245 [Microcoleus sp. FACHB-1515]|uniref:hypothetical protein n=1 Tax=Cyanophyceae TaxID=3028117 RepID=UPI0016898788|nr:hypothetical protein [Microcoleus sp. FACHB-1515]MBD2091592.1 hypothetical protein [Microcoleus sp. FACHB-1515]
MTESIALEALFAQEILDRFTARQSPPLQHALKACRRVRYDAQTGSIVLECPNRLLLKVIESLRSELEAIAAPAHLHIVMAGKGKCYW